MISQLDIYIESILNPKILIVKDASWYNPDINPTNGKIPKYTLEWRDVETDVFGAVLNDNGVPELTIIDSDDSPYTSKDLIKEKDLEKYKKDNFWIDRVLKGKNKAKVKYDCIRQIVFIPAEYVGDKDKDIVLSYGKKQYVPKYSYNYKNPDWSHKVKCWNYDNGEIMSPLDDLISPQRFLNRMLSMGESHINNTRGSSIIYDKSTVDARDGEAELLRNVNLGTTYRDWETDRKSTRLNSSHSAKSRMPSSA